MLKFEDLTDEDSVVEGFTSDKGEIMQRKLLMAVILISTVPGCWTPPDDDQLIEVVDGIIKVKHTLSKEDTPGTAAGHLASTAYTLAFKYPDALRMEYTIYWPSIGYDQPTGVVSVNTPEITLLRQTDSASTYKQDRVKDYKVAIYEACTPLALKCTADQIHEIIKYRRSAAYHDGISGISNVESPQILTSMEELVATNSLAKAAIAAMDDSELAQPPGCPSQAADNDENLIVGSNIVRLDNIIGQQGIRGHGANCPQRAAYIQAVSNIIAAEIISQAIERLAISLDPNIEPEPTPFDPDIGPLPLEREK